jgi:hypothetical protein
VLDKRMIDDVNLAGHCARQGITQRCETWTWLVVAAWQAVDTVVTDTNAAKAMATAKTASRTTDLRWRVAMVSRRFIMRGPYFTQSANATA